MREVVGYRRAAAVLIGLWLLVGLASVPAASAERYVVLGDSYSAGNGASAYDFDNNSDCLRSTKAYGPLIRGDLGATSSFRFVACSGAVINNIISNTQGSNPIQKTALGNDTLDVTFSIGGNDAGFSDVLLRCALPLVSCDGDIDNAQTYIRNTLPARLDLVYGQIRQGAPNARVGVIGYPRLFPANGDDCSAATFFSAGEITRLNQTADLLADVTRERARANGFSFIDSRPAFLGHAWCEDEWINGLSNPTNKSYHPNDRGYAGFAGIARAAHLAAPAPSFAPGPNGRITFSSDRDGNREIYVINGNGSHPINLSQNPSVDRDPVFSPDGTEIAFASNRDGDFEIYKMPAAGGAATKLTSNTSDDLEPSWAPNGKQIVFRSSRDGNDEIYKMAANGSGQTRLTQNTASDTSPAFSPDGSEIVFQRFTSGTAPGQGNQIFKMNSDGQGQINLTANSASISDGSPKWSPDGSRIAFHSNRSGQYEIYSMTATGSSVVRLTNEPGDDLNPSFSPSGSHITFESNRSGSSQIFTMDATGSAGVRRTSGVASEISPSWQGDSRPPVTSIDSAPPASSNNPVGSFTFSSDEAGSTFECSLNGSAFVSCSSPFVTDPLDDGTHQFSVRAKDPSGNLDPSPVAASFGVDTAGKLTSITIAPSGPIKINDPTFEFISEDGDVTFECRLFPAGESEPSWTDCASPYVPSQLDDGNYRFEVRGTDGVGNVEDPPQRRDFTVDTVAPVTAITFGPAAIGVNNRPVFEFTADQAGSTFECRLDESTGATWTACESPWSGGTLDDGEHRFEVRATDPAGNLEVDPVELDFRIDTSVPSTTIESGPTAAEPSADVSFSFIASESAVRFECRLDSFDDADWAACGSPKEYTGLNHGRHSFQVRAIDQAGNVESPAATSEFGVKTDPGLEITSTPSAVSSNTDPEIVFAADDPDMDFECRLNEKEWEPCASPFHPGAEVPLTDGEFSFELRGTDWFGEKVGLPRLEWTVVSGPPRPTIVSSPRGLDNSRVAVFEIDGGWGVDSVQCQIDGLAWRICETGVPAGTRLQTATFEGLHDGPHRLRIRASNSLFGFGLETSYEWVIDATPPEAKINRAPARRVASATSKWEFSGAGNPTGFRCRVNGEPPAGSTTVGSDGFGTCTSPLELTMADGEHRFDLIAIDEAGNLSPAITRVWTVDTTGPRTEFKAVPEDSTNRTATIEFAADESPSVFTCRLDDADWRSCASPVSLQGLAAGSHRFEVKATDSLGNVGESAVHDWQVKTVSRPRPTISMKRRVKLNRAGRAVVATISCSKQVTCDIRTPFRARVKLGKRWVVARFLAPRSIRPGKRVMLRIVVPRRAAKSIGRAPVRLDLTRARSKIVASVRAV